MDFIHFINNAISKQEPNRGLYGQIIVDDYDLVNVKLAESINITATESLWMNVDAKENCLKISFKIAYKQYHFAEIGLAIDPLSQFECITSTHKTTNVQDAIEWLNDEPNMTFNIELSPKKITLTAQNHHSNFQLVGYFRQLNIDIELLNRTAFIDQLEHRTKDNSLFKTLCKTINKQQLIAIASADYGYDADVFKELKLIRDNQTPPKEVSFEVFEVLGLTRYSKPKTQQEHQARAFASAAILLLEKNTSTDDIDNVLSTLFISASQLDGNIITQTHGLFLFLLANNDNAAEIKVIAYLLLGCDLLLAKKRFNDSFTFLKTSHFLAEVNFEYDTSLTAKRMKEVTLIMLKNTAFIDNQSLKKELKAFFTAITRICEERYEIKALFERTFTQTQQVEYLRFLPEIKDMPYLEKCDFLLEQGLSSKQVELFTRSLTRAKLFVEGHDNETALSRNVFFDAYVEQWGCRIMVCERKKW